ncbi:RnfABCDGE type electron transport complex subunit G [Natranaerobius trueperi]|uniref:FMN-binding protein n=1 Tax=Natranaerobius trueperi TaxID=759412 RepID=UPI001303803B|nr:RnfABCDGE type electron transport complex subunit G [Natranaerobius trueperi]
MDVKELIKLSLSLMIITVISAGVLAFTNDITGPIIAEQRLAALQDSLEDVFPESDDLKVNEIDDREYYEVIQDGEIIGAATIVQPGGYGGEIEMMIAVDTDGLIQGVEVLAHSETPGLGDAIEDEEWRNQFIGLGLEDDIALGTDVDTISGATVSANAAIQGANEGLELISFNLFDFEKPETDVDLAEVDDGIYQGEGSGLEPGVVVEVTVKDNEITDIEIIDHNDTPDYFEDAQAEIPDRILDEQSADVDVVSGATLSSEGIKEAVLNALLGDDDKEDSLEEA